jgi:endonuclease YncB( thermonuclease family)
MATGQLRVEGTIDLSQFWPTGSADADTTKVLVDVERGAFQFRENDGARFQTTRAFDNAIVIGKGRRPAINSQGRITIRLQGIDAPELHYRPQSHLTDSQGRTAEQRARYLEANEEYRQYLAETATVRLGQFLGRANRDPLPCVVVTAVDAPDEVFDCYGRFVGDIIVEVDRVEHNVNQWLVRQGLAYPAFYNSMSAEEIQALWGAADQAWAAGRFLWPALDDYVRRESFDWDLLYRRPSTNPSFVQANDLGSVVLPKLFRRLSAYAVNRYAGMVTGTFWSYLDNRRDDFHLTEEFLDEPTAAPVRYLHEYLHVDGFFELWPEQMTFRERSSRLIRPGGGDVRW